jgi:hypothetical protein
MTENNVVPIRAASNAPPPPSKKRARGPRGPTRSKQAEAKWGEVLTRIDALIRIAAVCAAAAEHASGESGGFAREAAASLPGTLEDMREELCALHGEIERKGIWEARS